MLSNSPHRSLSTVLVLEILELGSLAARQMQGLQNGQPVQDLMRRRWKHELADYVAVALATLWLSWLLVAQW